eukprot:10022595-Lingulodinium_polyedra.AAC.1
MFALGRGAAVNDAFHAFVVRVAMELGDASNHGRPRGQWRETNRAPCRGASAQGSAAAAGALSSQ